jgi:beta-phosphoglucomutase-like phosphatase (HAD superfamily)
MRSALVATVFDLDETPADSAATWQHVIGGVAARHGHAWAAADWAAIQGTATDHRGTYPAHRCRDLTPARAVAECVGGMVAALGHGRFGLLPGAARGRAGPGRSGVGVAPARCLAVEDSGSGIRSATPRGMTVLAIPNATTALADHQATDALVAAKTVEVVLRSGAPSVPDGGGIRRPGRGNGV